MLRAIKSYFLRPSRIEREVMRLQRMVETHRRETRLALAELMLPHRSEWQPPIPFAGTPAQNMFQGGALCRQDVFSQPYFHYWCNRICEPVRYHRKQWEFTFILQAAWERGLMVPGKRALGFGVGMEPLSAVFASHDVHVTATDMSDDSMMASGWQSTEQHASGKAALRYEGICPHDVFERNVEFAVCDMNHIPEALNGYDFCWSSCALEHLGSIERGLAFIERSLECLRPGGWAIHTTEFNLSSNTETVDNYATVLFRRKDLEALFERLQSQGHEIAPFDWTLGTQPLDQYFDLPPYRAEPHLAAVLAGFKTTSIGLIVRKAL